jgi:quinol monooxygenase YgiN
MYITYVTFELPPNIDRDAFEEWFIGIVRRYREEPGCVAYDYLRNPEHPTQGCMIEVWESLEDAAVHFLTPAHIEMVALGTAKWGLHNIQTHRWTAAEGHGVAQRTSTHVGIEGRVEMYRLVTEFLAAHPQN